MAALWWTTTVGMLFCLGILGGAFIHFVNRGLNSEDSHLIDSVQSDDPKGDSEENSDKTQEL